MQALSRNLASRTSLVGRLFSRETLSLSAGAVVEGVSRVNANTAIDKLGVPM